MTAEPSRAVLDRRDDGRGAVPHDDGAALSTVENGEAVALPSVGGLVRGLAFTLAQARPVRREATRLARDWPGSRAAPASTCPHRGTSASPTRPGR